MIVCEVRKIGTSGYFALLTTRAGDAEHTRSCLSATFEKLLFRVRRRVWFIVKRLYVQCI